MQIHWQLPEVPLLSGCALTVGTFDGVHRGHQALLAALRQEAASRGLPSAALTFVDMPLCFLKPVDCPRLLTLAAEKAEAFEQTGLDHLFLVPFDAAVAQQSASEFMEFWHRQVGLKLFLSGPDFAMGRNREGNILRLREIGQQLGFEVLPLNAKLLEDGLAISSTRCRESVERGEVAQVEKLLGRPFAVSGGIVPGQQLGRTIGVPTLNMQPDPRKLLPLPGVYAVRASWPGQGDVPAVLNLGTRPTVGGSDLRLEFHVLDRQLDQSPAEATVQFVARLRAEEKFAGLPALQAQIQRDMAQARVLLGLHG